MKNKLFLICIIFFCLVSLSFAKEASDVSAQAKAAFDQGSFDKAIELYEKAIKLDPNNAEAYNNLGLSYRAMNAKPSEFAWYFKTAIEINPQYAEAYDNLGKAYYGMGDFEKAEEYCQKALEVKPGLGSAEFSLAWIYLLGKSDPSQAIYFFKKTLEKTQIPHAYFGLGLAYFMNKESPLVLETITKLKDIGQEKLAAQLENIVRGHQYIPDNSPLVDIPFQQEKAPGVIVKSGEKTQQQASQEESEPSPVQGTSKIRMRGTLFNVGKDGQAQPAEGKAGGSSSNNASDDVAPAETSTLKIQGDAQVISGDHYRTERIRSMRHSEGSGGY